MFQSFASTHGVLIGELNYIFVSDEELLEMNRQYLDHDYFTDIITFDNSEQDGKIEGDVFISWERVVENGKSIGNGVLEEYVRVIGHGFWHLLGFGDKSDIEREEMRRKENAFIDTYIALTS